MTKDLNWSKLNPTLHSLCLAGRARRNKFCSACLSDNHSVEQCPEAWQMFPPFGSAGQYRSASPLPPFYPHPGPFPFVAGGGQPPAPPFGPPGVPTCKLFNKPEGPRCTFMPCKYAHVCTICRGPHARAECRARAAAAKRPSSHSLFNMYSIYQVVWLPSRITIGALIMLVRVYGQHGESPCRVGIRQGVNFNRIRHRRGSGRE